MLNKIYIEFDYGQGAAIGVMIMTLLFTFAVIYIGITSRKED